MAKIRQLFQDLKEGNTFLEEIPCPSLREGKILIKTSKSLVSPGTERMLVDFGRSSFLGKAKAQPEKVKQVIEKVKTDGIATTWKAVQHKLSVPIPLGYSNVGRVIEVNESDQPLGLNPGDRVLSNGAHGEVVSIAKNLCVPIPPEVSDEEASFTVLGAIGLNGIRLLAPTLGETFLVIGVGLIGLLSIQILRASGCKVVACDVQKKNLKLAESFGAETFHIEEGSDLVAFTQSFTKNRGVDGVLICASTDSSKPLENAAKACRKRGRIVLVGVVGMELDRGLFYHKELSFQVSCSYGPGRYDPTYEEEGIDYPLPFVRWTEQRNFEAILQLMKEGKLQTKPLISHRYSFSEAPLAYETLHQGEGLGILLEYGDLQEKEENYSKVINFSINSSIKDEPSLSKFQTIGVIGAGMFAGQILLPQLKGKACRKKWIVSPSGTKATILGKKLEFEQAGSDAEQILDDNDVGTIMVLTRHDSHARYLLEGLKRGKKVYLEKPLCIKEEEWLAIYHQIRSMEDEGSLLQNQIMVGFNRRFSPFVTELKKELAKSSTPIGVSITVNAPPLPVDHWLKDVRKGGGRLIGEACHFIDLSRFLTGSPIQRVFVSPLGERDSDSFSIQLEMENGSTASIQYFTNGHQSYPKEKINVFFEGKIGEINNFKSLKYFGKKGQKKAWAQDKGHEIEISRFVDSLSSAEELIPLEEIFEVSLVALAAEKSLKEMCSYSMSNFREEVLKGC